MLDYLKLIPKVFENPKEIWEGWKNAAKLELGSLPEDQVEEIVKRRMICEACPFMSSNIPNYQTSRVEKHCTLCSCPILSKTASLSSICGADYYNKTHPEKDPLEVRWLPYEEHKS